MAVRRVASRIIEEISSKVYVSSPIRNRSEPMSKGSAFIGLLVCLIVFNQSQAKVVDILGRTRELEECLCNVVWDSYICRRYAFAYCLL